MMRTFILIFLCMLVNTISLAQVDVKITEKETVYNEKGDYYLDRNAYKKAIVYYNMAYQKDASDYFSILKKAEAYTKMKLYPQAEECYRIVFESKQKVDNAFRLKYALVLLSNQKEEEFKKWLGIYSQLVEEEIKGENYLISSESRIKLYKDSTIVLVSDDQKPDSIHFKIKYEGYRYKRRSSMEDDKVNLLMSNGDEYNIAAAEKDNFEFSFHPLENYKLIIQRENVMANEIILHEEQTSEQRKKRFLTPLPVQKAEIKLQQGMKYRFTAGQNAISPQYRNLLKEKARNYQTPGENTINLTALVKELQFTKGEVYTLRFVKDNIQVNTYKGKEVSTLIVNDKAVNIFGYSFFIMLPLKEEVNFTVQTDMEVMEQNYSPKKYALLVDDGPVFKEIKVPAKCLLTLTVNTDSIEKVNPVNRLSANEISIISGTEYILTLSKPDLTTGEDIEIIVPLTRGVKYNLGLPQKSNDEFREALAEILTGRKDIEPSNEEVIDISILSKELEVKPGEELSFNLLPVKQFGKKPALTEEMKSSLMLDGKVIEITRHENYAITLPFDNEQKVNFQTDLDYIRENFEADAFTLNVDTISFFSEIAVDTTGYGDQSSSGWLSMSINTDAIEEVEKQNQLTAREVSIIPAKEYILTVSKVDAITGEEEEIFVPLTRQVKYDFTSDPGSNDAYRESLHTFIKEREDIETIDGEVIDIKLLSKELKIQEGDEISFSLLPVKDLSKKPTTEVDAMSSLFIDNKLVEFTHIQKYTIHVPLNGGGQVNMQTDLEHLQENFEPGSFTLDVDTIAFFSEIAIDTTGLGYRVIHEEEQIKDPVFDVITVNFNLNEYSLLPEAKITIQENVIDELKGDSRLYVTIKGYTDALGDADYNLNLSKKRAESVKEFLKSNEIGEGRIRTFSFGESKSLQEGVNWEDLNEEELRKHRKVEIVIYIPK